MTRVFITGAGGFCGHHFIDHFLVNTDWEIFAMHSGRNGSLPEKILNSEHYKLNKHRVTLISHDLNFAIPQDIQDILADIDYVINLASLSHIENSINDPANFILNNVKITLNLYEFLKKSNIKKIIQFSTDEIYGPIVNDILHKEWSSIVPSNPYSASKAAQEDIAISYWKTYSMPIIITNTMTIFGERQGIEKYIPKIVKALMDDETLTIHSINNQAGFRSYLHARNAADAIMFILNNISPVLPSNSVKPERLNIVSPASFDNFKIAEKISHILNKPLKYELVDVTSIRPGQDYKYGLDGTKLSLLGYQYPVDFEQSLRATINWMIKPENRKFINK